MNASQLAESCTVGSDVDTLVPSSRPSSDTIDLERQSSPSVKDQPLVNQSEKAPPSKHEVIPDTIIVEWDGPNDPAHPQNWKVWKKCWVTSIWVYACLVTCIASSIFSCGSRAIKDEFHVSTLVTTLGTSLFVLGYTFGPPVWGPISERFGRQRPLIVGMFVFTLFCLPSALGTNIQTLLVGRFFAGTFGAAPLATFGGAISDIWGPIARGVALATCLGAVFGSPILAPLMGNWMTQNIQPAGWRWNSWLSFIMGVLCTIVALALLPETSHPFLLKRKAQHLRAVTGDPRHRCVHDDTDAKGPRAIVTVYLSRPFVLLLTEPILLLVTLHQAFVYGILYLLFGSFPIEFQQSRGWSLGLSSLPYLGIFVGVVLGALTIVVYTLTVFKRQTRRNHGVVCPEQRLPIMIAGACLMPVGFFVYGWTSSSDIPWPGMVVGCIPLGAGLYMVFVQGFNYLIDVYLAQANSAIGGNTFVRSFFGFGFPLFGPAMYHRLGVPWASSLLGFVSLAMLPIPVVFYLYGERIRGWSRKGSAQQPLKS